MLNVTFVMCNMLMIKSLAISNSMKTCCDFMCLSNTDRMHIVQIITDKRHVSKVRKKPCQTTALYSI